MVGNAAEGAPERPATGGPPAWVVLLVTGIVAAVVVGGIVGYRAWRGDADDEDAADAPVTAAPSTSADPGDVPAARLFTRTTSSGIELRVDTGDGDEMGVDFGMGVADGAPDSCRIVGQAMATAITRDEVLQGWLPLTKAPTADPAPALLNGMLGMNMRAGGVLGVVVQVADDAVSTRLSTPGAVDEMAPVEGIAALALTIADAAGDDVTATTRGGRFGPAGDQFDDVTLAVTYADGRVRQVGGEDLMSGPQVWRGDGVCAGAFEGQPADTLSPEQEEELFGVHLPPPGAQPADPVAARAAIEATMGSLYGAGDDVDVLALIDDPFAMRETFDRIGENDVGIEWTQTTGIIEELVFLSPVEAAFEYALEVDVADLGRDELFGRARLVDGTWRIGRGTICRDLLEVFATACPP